MEKISAIKRILEQSGLKEARKASQFSKNQHNCAVPAAFQAIVS